MRLSRDEAFNAYYRANGHPPPSAPFPAIITGVAIPQHQVDGRLSPSAQLIHPLPSCTDPPEADATIDTPSVNGFYAPQFLPCGVRWPRYRWIAVHSKLSSEGYGLRRTSDGKFKAWRQALFALNVFDSLADYKLNYPFVPLGANVILAWGPIDRVTANPNDADNIAPAPGWGFYFSHPVDPEGTWRCPPQTFQVPFDPQGCCLLRDPQLGIVLDQFCATLGVCASFNPTFLATWAGDGVDCPGEPCQGSGVAGGHDCEPVGPPGYVAGSVATPSQRMVALNHKLGGCFDSFSAEGTPELPPNGEPCYPTIGG